MHHLFVEPSFRLHFNLLSMHGCAVRINGGSGVAIKIPNFSICVSAFDDLFFDADPAFLDSAAEHIKFLINFVNKRNFSVKARFTIPKGYPMHIGLGGGTSLRLIVIESLFLLNEVKYDRSDVVYASCRGGASGIGINTYFSGGFILDAGRKVLTDSKHQPSSRQASFTPPLKLISSCFPNWYLKIVIPKNKFGLNSVSEVDFFKNSCPIEAHEAFKAVYYSAFCLSASVVESDFKGFKIAISETQSTGWKRLEIESHGSLVDDLLTSVKSYDDVACGMTSMGPAVYCISPNLLQLERLISSIDASLFNIIDASFDNSGRGIILV